MTKFTPLFALFAGCMANATLLHAQVFTSDLTQWSALGDPLVSNSSTATLYSTDDNTSTPSNESESASVSATTLQNVLLNGGTLQNSYGSGGGSTTNGQALYLTFNLAGAATVTFNWQMTSNDGAPYDGVGYVLNNVYYELADPPNYAGAYTGPVDTATVTLPAGTDTFGFVAFNTGGAVDSTNLQVTNVALTAAPEPNSALLALVLGLALVVLRKARSSGFSSYLRRGLKPLSSCRGQTLVEYSLILAFISVVAIGVLISTGGSVKGIFTTVSNQLAVSANGGPFATPPGH